MQTTTADSGAGHKNTVLWIAATILFVGLLIRSSGLYPCILADETVHSKVCRLVPRWEAEIPAYLYAGIYRICNRAGDAYLSCARILNTLFFVGSLPFLFWTARRFCSRGVAATLAIVSLLGPVNTYTAYFMPEAMYFFGFWVLAWLVSALDGESGWVAWGVTGITLGLLSLVKPHALFSVHAMLLYAAAVSREGGAGWLPRAIRNIAALAAATFLTKMSIGYVCAGRAGLNPFGKLYGDIASQTASHSDRFVQLVKMASENVVGHALALCLTCGLAFAATVAIGTRVLLSKTTRQPQERFALFACLLLANLMAVTSLYTASVNQPDQQIRLHTRYYEFVFPALFMIVASQLSPMSRPPRKAMRVACAVPIGAAIVYALATRMQPWLAVYHDDPEVRGCVRDDGVFWLLGGGFLSVLVLWVFAARAGAALFVFCLLQLANLLSTYQVVQDLEPLRTADAYDRAGLFARQYLANEDRSKLVVMGSSPPGLYRALFHVDNARARFVDLPENAPYDPARIPPGDTEWVLFVGSGWKSEDSVFALQMEGFTLARTSRVLTVDFRRDSWAGILTACDNVSEPGGFGRWSTDKVVTLEFARRLPEKFTVRLMAVAFGPNAGKEFVARVGASTVKFTLKAQEEERLLEFDNPGQLRTLTIDVPNAISPKDLGVGPDERPLGIGLVQVAQKTHDEMGRDPMGRLGFVNGTLDAVDHRGEGYAAGEMALGIEKDLGMAQTLGLDLVEIGCRQIVEILLRQQHRHALVVEIEEVLQPGESIGSAQRGDIGIGQGDVVAPGQREHHLRLQCSFDMDMELALGQAVDMSCQLAHHPLETAGPVPEGAGTGPDRIGQPLRFTSAECLRYLRRANPCPAHRHRPASRRQRLSACRPGR